MDQNSPTRIFSLRKEAGGSGAAPVPGCYLAKLEESGFLFGWPPMDLTVLQNTDMHIWHGINSQVERKLAKDIRKWQEAGYAFTYKVFPNVGHGGLNAEHTEQFIEEVKTVHAASLEKEKIEFSI